MFCYFDMNITKTYLSSNTQESEYENQERENFNHRFIFTPFARIKYESYILFICVYEKRKKIIEKKKALTDKATHKCTH